MAHVRNGKAAKDRRKKGAFDRCMNDPKTVALIKEVFTDLQDTSERREDGNADA